MKPLIVLILTFLVTLLLTCIGQGGPLYGFAGCVAMSVMLLFTAIGHFKFRHGMTGMLPEWFPAKRFAVTVSGLIEIAAAVGLQIASLRLLTGWLLILFFVVILPANLSAALRHLNYETGERNGPGPRYLWFRIPMQIFLIAWVYAFAISAQG